MAHWSGHVHPAVVRVTAYWKKNHFLLVISDQQLLILQNNFMSIELSSAILQIFGYP